MGKTTTSTKREEPPTTLKQFLKGPPVVTQRSLAKLAGVSQAMVSMLVRHKRKPRIKLLLKLSAITGIPVERLAGARPKKPRDPPPGEAAA